MLSTFLIVFVAMAIIVAIMAVGVMFGRKPIAGSCGGMSAIGMESECDVCGGDKTKCDNEVKSSKRKGKSELAYDATR
ncbi:(Na+)-NQR maturation NqrM [Reinekea sp. G2M2-21]|uniref:(Na+)-NQR maturation NqrM n=1 Tax=Reinekea sp. G2M2-21 TaxID=2788942 RepID=UPI0018AC4EBC|nr:(Na+)-NQR maturation NqrM [Reinekea sp. G2M2-21]